MSGYLLDTHTLLWAFEGHSDLSRRAGRLIEDPANDVVISIVACWELQIKQTIGKVRVASECNDRLW
jgi:PIN domain nuclease of toxin-antitoxin system